MFNGDTETNPLWGCGNLWEICGKSVGMASGNQTWPENPGTFAEKIMNGFQQAMCDYQTMFGNGHKLQVNEGKICKMMDK